MNLSFPLNDVQIEISAQQKRVESPIYKNENFEVSQNQFSIDIKGVAWYFVSKGKQIQITPCKDAKKLEIELFLNSWGLVSVLHQRTILNFHASSFQFNKQGIMICGDSGAGKSSLTAAFSFNNACFLSDDVTPIVFSDTKPFIKVIPNKLALKKETIEQLKLSGEKQKIRNTINGKQLFSMLQGDKKNVALKQVFWISICKNDKLEYTELNGLEKFKMLRGEICGWDILKGMKETETVYLSQLMRISKEVRITKIARPLDFPLMELKNSIENYLGKNVN